MPASPSNSDTFVTPTSSDPLDSPDSPVLVKRRIRIVVEYDGTAYHGWQLQPGLDTIQGALEGALSRLAGAPVQVSRTIVQQALVDRMHDAGWPIAPPMAPGRAA